MTTPVIGVVVGTFGDESWRRRGQRAADAAAAVAGPGAVTHVHADTLAEARNTGAMVAAGRGAADWLVFLDADDELEAGYIEAMTAAIVAVDSPAALFQPRTRGIYPDGAEDADANFITRDFDSLLIGNWLVIGTAISVEMFNRAGGFDEWPIAEDWALWVAAYAHGAKPHRVEGAVYRIGVLPGSRNQAMSERDHARVCIQIRARWRPVARANGIS